MSTLLIGLIVLFVGMGLSGLMLHLILKKHNKIATWQKTSARVTGFDTTESDGSTLYAPIVEFLDHQGQSRTHRSGTYSSPQKLDAGDSVTIAFDPLAPDQATLLSFSEMYLPHTVGLGFGVVAMLVGGLMVVTG
ncbi:MAG TPA: DUF3592 domain-containing protein [Fibrobacteria bacterium]|nr:DUF3592 domain-containing protein [Fibrobacteria bacterium]